LNTFFSQPLKNLNIIELAIPVFSDVRLKLVERCSRQKDSDLITGLTSKLTIGLVVTHGEEVQSTSTLVVQMRQ
jgi:hypothetical protein